MPPAVPAESESESEPGVEEIPQTSKSNPSAQVDDELADAINNEKEEDEEEDEEDEDAEVYIVEAVKDHGAAFPDGQMRYHIKWKGYEKKSDMTWETEENLEGARDLLEAYFESIGGKPKIMTKAQALSKKRSRLSLKGSDTPEKAKKQKKVVRKSNASLNIEQTPDPAAGYTEVGDDDWKPPTPLNGAWDPLVQAVDTIEKDDNNELWAYLVWNDKNHDGRFYRSKARLATCNTSCPQKMLVFYEKHVVFTQNRSNFVENNGTT